MSGQPWMKFYPADWRADTSLRLCEPMSRYVWLEMIGIMHGAEPYGHLVMNGKPITAEAISRLIDVPVKAVNQAIKELGRNGVFSVTDDGIIYSRRMVRDELKATSNRLNGTRGGNPHLKNQRVSDTSVNPPVKGEVKAQKPEARSQIPDNVSSDEDTRPRDALAMLSEVLDVTRSKAVLQHRRSRKLAVSEHAIGLLVANLKACPDPNAAADEMILRGWTSVKAEWLERDKPRQQAPPQKPTNTPAAIRREADVDYLEAILGVPKRDEFNGTTLDLAANG